MFLSLCHATIPKTAKHPQLDHVKNEFMSLWSPQCSRKTLLCLLSKTMPPLGDIFIVFCINCFMLRSIKHLIKETSFSLSFCHAVSLFFSLFQTSVSPQSLNLRFLPKSTVFPMVATSYKWLLSISNMATLN